MPYYAIDNIRPVVHPDSYVHPTATLIGDVIIGANCYIGPSAVLRGDFGRLVLQDGANLQDTCVMHGFPGTDTLVEENGHIGHGAVLHGCHVGKNALVGMNSVVMDGAKIGESAIVAAMCFVKANMVIPDRHLALGNPAKVVRELSDTEITWKISGTKCYQELAQRSSSTMVETTPLRAPEAHRQRLEFPDIVPLHNAKKQQR